MARRAIVPLRGTEAQRATAAAAILSGEIHTTTDQLRIFVQNQLLNSVNHGSVANAAARLALDSGSSRGCRPGDTAFQADTGILYQCTANDGSSSGDWLAIASPGASAFDLTAVVADPNVLTDDSIQDAIDAAEAAGIADVIIPAGVWLMDAALIVPSGIRLRGSLGGTILRRNDSGLNNLLRNSDSTVGSYAGNVDISLEDIVFDGNRATHATAATLCGFIHCSFIAVRRCSFIGVYDWHGLELNACQACVVEDCVFDDFQRHDANEEQLQIDAATGSGPWPWETGTTLYNSAPCRDIRISRCRFSRGSAGIGTHTTASGLLHREIRVSDCVFEDHTHYGAILPNWTDSSFERCTFRDQEIAIYCAPANSNHVDRLAISDCTFLDCDKTADTSRAIQLAGQSDLSATVRWAKISRCVCHTVGRHAIGLDYALHCLVSGCSVTDTSRVGIFIFRSQGCQVSDNQLSGNGATAGSTEKDITIGSDSSVTNNTLNTIVRGNICDDLYVRQYTTRTIISDNVIGALTVNGSATECRRHDNFVAGSWVA